MDQQKHSLKALVSVLKDARERKRLSQRALGERIGVPQSHISKIENGKVDLQASSLVELARALDLEVMLVPRSLVPAVEAMSRPAQRGSDTLSPVGVAAQESDAAPIRQAHLALEKIERDAERASRALGHAPELTRLAEAARELDHMRFSLDQAHQIREAAGRLKLPKDTFKNVFAAQRNVQDAFRSTDVVVRSLREAAKAADAFRNLRNMLAHGAIEPTTRVQPAYRLQDEDDDA
jgi:transcriptional regulator with XRE-family HTH domain